MSPLLFALLCLGLCPLWADIMVRDDFLYYETDWPDPRDAAAHRCERTGATLVGNMKAFLTSGSLNVLPCYVSYSCCISTYELDGRVYLNQTREEVDNRLWKQGHPITGKDYGVVAGGRRRGEWALSTVMNSEFHTPLCVNDLTSRHSVQKLDKNVYSIGYKDFADKIKVILDRLRREKPELFDP